MEEFLHEEIKFSDSQIVDAFKRVEAGLGFPDICRELGRFRLVITQEMGIRLEYI